MVTKKSGDPSPESIARANRQRVAQEEGVRAMADAAQQAVAVRKNMERLRALRQTREAQEPVAPPPKARKASKRKKELSK